MNVNVWDVGEPVQKLIRSRRKIDAARLRDPGLRIEQFIVHDG